MRLEKLDMDDGREFEIPKLVQARRLSQSDCREEAFIDGSVYTLATVNSFEEFCLVRQVAEIAVNMCDGNEQADIWMEDER